MEESLQRQRDSFSAPNYPWFIIAMCQLGSLGWVKYGQSEGLSIEFGDCAAAAARGGNIHMLVYLRENGCCWDDRTTKYAALRGHLTLLKYAHENGCDWDYKTCRNAAEGRHLDCLEYAYSNGCPWDTDTIHAAACANSVDCLQYAYEHGCPWKESLFMSVKLATRSKAAYRYYNAHMRRNIFQAHAAHLDEVLSDEDGDIESVEG